MCSSLGKERIILSQKHQQLLLQHNTTIPDKTATHQKLKTVQLPHKLFYCKEMSKIILSCSVISEKILFLQPLHLLSSSIYFATLFCNYLYEKAFIAFNLSVTIQEVSDTITVNSIFAWGVKQLRNCLRHQLAISLFF